MTERRKDFITLGVHHGHDSGASIVVDGHIIADVAEERFTRLKHCADVPRHAIRYCLERAGLTSIDEVDAIAVAGFTITPGLSALFGIQSNSPKDRLKLLAASLGLNFGRRRLAAPTYLYEFMLSDPRKLVHVEHHLAHAAAAHLTRPSLSKALVFTIDGSGDQVSTAVWLAEGSKIEPLQKFYREASIGFAYSAVTEGLGWWHGDGEGKTMGLAPYGDPDVCYEEIERLFPSFDGTQLARATQLSTPLLWPEMSAAHWHMREAEYVMKLADRHGRENVAASAQKALEKVVTGYVKAWAQRKACMNLAFSGGVFLNVKLNQRIWQSRDGLFEEQHIFPNCGDSGLAAGAALYVAAQLYGAEGYGLSHLYLGPEHGTDEIARLLKSFGLAYSRTDTPEVEAAKHLVENRIVGWFQGRMESGPRALGNRSILMSPLRHENKDIINETVKFREGFRPFCPSLLYEKRDDYLKDARDEFFMITSFEVTEAKRDKIPAVVHVDGTVRPQLVKRTTNPRYWDLIKAFGDLSGEYVVLNTSFNVRGEPIICSPAEAVRCFFSNGLDVLIIDGFVVAKNCK